MSFRIFLVNPLSKSQILTSYPEFVEIQNLFENKKIKKNLYLHSVFYTSTVIILYTLNKYMTEYIELMNSKCDTLLLDVITETKIDHEKMQCVVEKKQKIFNSHNRKTIFYKISLYIFEYKYNHDRFENIYKKIKHLCT